jgi:exonuclease III
MKILSINCQSWNTAKSSINKTVENNDIDVICLTETWATTNSPVKFRNWQIIGKPRPDDSGRGGVAIAYKPADDVYIKRLDNLEDPDTEAICVQVTLKNKVSFLLVAAYVPPESHIDQLERLFKIIERSNYQNIVITGDLNAKSQEWDNINYNMYGKRMEEFLHARGLVCVNDGVPTMRKGSSVIDLFIVNPALVPRISTCVTLTQELIRSDHIGVELELDKTVNSNQDSVERFIVSKPDWDNWTKTTETLFGEWNRENKDKEWNSVEEMYDSFSQVFIQCRDSCVPKKVVPAKRRRTTPSWMSDTVNEARHLLNATKKNFKRRSTDQNYQKLLQAKSKCEKAEDEAKEKWVDSVCVKLNSSKNPKDLWDCFRQLTSYQERDGCDVLPLVNEKGEPEFEKEVKSKILQRTFFSGEHLEKGQFDKDFKEEIERELENIVLHQDCEKKFNTDYLDQPISLGETIGALGYLIKGKAAGPDKVFTDLLMKASDSMITAIHGLFQKVYEEGEIPRDWKTAEVRFIRKPGKKSFHEPSAY